MHRPVPFPQPLGQPAAPRAELAPFLTPSLATVVSGARRRALRDGDRQIDTAHLLHSLVESDPEVGAALGGGRAAQVLGYLVQRSIGYGLRWQRSVEGSAAGRPLPAVRGSGARGSRAASAWSPAASAALTEAFRRAAVRGDPQARGTDVLAGITADPECRAVEVLRRAGIDTAALNARLAAGSTTVEEAPLPPGEGEPSQQV
ncbi:Clp protease N-terminal domain-containing protein [Streptomyces sp. NPDC088557]|uniref:Clp protease N-terminal domain-containing protein n=1 Tax=Streptomyces sp. NPDC088557 TaxID=3365867 RepID=UPI0037F94133